MWAPTSAAGGMLGRLAARQARAVMHQCAYATATTSSSTASANSSEGPSTSGRDPSTWRFQQQSICADPCLTILATDVLADMYRLWPTGPAVPKHLAEMSFEQLMDHWQTQNHRKFAMGELLTSASRTVTAVQLQSSATVPTCVPCALSCQHHTAADTMPTHLSCCLLAARRAQTPAHGTQSIHPRAAAAAAGRATHQLPPPPACGTQCHLQQPPQLRPPRGGCWGSR